ncbi:hypothetical protein BC629DRAFT_1590498 [Irpex lacteus]|nr:hypothetical protein BC629DRAFT_1590498 [Irpex lacteus]
MNSDQLERLLAERLGGGLGRPIEELLKTDEPLKGVESQRLRTYFTSNQMIPARDLDEYGRLIFMGDLDGVKRACARRLATLKEGGMSEEDAIVKAGREQADLRWGPTQVPIFDLILLARVLVPDRRDDILKVARYLIDETKVPVGSRDLSGSMTLLHAIGTKPTFDPELAQILYDAGEDVNARNRYGCTAAHDICMVQTGDASAVQPALRWFLAHGGNADVQENDGISSRQVLKNLATVNRSNAIGRVARSLLGLIEDEDKRRADLGNKCCTFCGKEEGKGSQKLMACSRCKKARYCAPTPLRNCQKGDWPVHKKNCIPVS